MEINFKYSNPYKPNMKIYFAGSIRGGRQDIEYYKELIEHLKKHGTVLTEHIASSELTSMGEEQLQDEEIYNRDLEWLNQAEIVIAEVTTPSLGVGYELAIAEQLNKPILCLYRPEKRISAMLAGNKKLRMVAYNSIEEATKAIDNFIKNVRD